MRKNKFLLTLVLLALNKFILCQEKNFIDIVHEGINSYRVDTVLFTGNNMDLIDTCKLSFLDLEYKNLKIFKHKSGILRYDYYLTNPDHKVYVFYTNKTSNITYSTFGIRSDTMNYGNNTTYFFNGLIVYNKEDSVCYFANFCSSTPMLLFIDKKTGGWDEIIQDERIIDRVFQIDKKLNPVYRINLEKDTVISYSYIKKTDNGYREKIRICFNNKSLYEVTLKKMYYLMQGGLGACEKYNLTFTVEPMYNRTIEKFGVIDFNHPGYK